VEILQIHALRSSLHSLPYRTPSQLKSKSKSHCDWRSVSQFKSWCRTPSYLLLFDSYGLVLCVAPSLARGRGWRLYVPLALPAQSFSDPSPLGLETIFYCLRFETSLFVASYDSHGFPSQLTLSVLITPRHGPHRITPFPLLYSNCCSIKNLLPSNGNVFSEPLHRNGRCLQSHWLAMLYSDYTMRLSDWKNWKKNLSA
jgi:hypothetical protein